MHAKVILQRVAALERVIDALAEELLESTDEELLQAARDLGMDPLARGSAAFIGIRYPAASRLEDFFELPVPPPAQIGTDERPEALPSASRRPGGRKRKPRS